MQRVTKPGISPNETFWSFPHRRANIMAIFLRLLMTVAATHAATATLFGRFEISHCQKVTGCQEHPCALLISVGLSCRATVSQLSWLEMSLQIEIIRAFPSSIYCKTRQNEPHSEVIIFEIRHSLRRPTQKWKSRDHESFEGEPHRQVEIVVSDEVIACSHRIRTRPQSIGDSCMKFFSYNRCRITASFVSIPCRPRSSASIFSVQDTLRDARAHIGFGSFREPQT